MTSDTANQARKLLKALHDVEILHGGVAASNFLFEESSQKVHLIDLSASIRLPHISISKQELQDRQQKERLALEVGFSLLSENPINQGVCVADFTGFDVESKKNSVADARFIKHLLDFTQTYSLAAGATLVAAVATSKIHQIQVLPTKILLSGMATVHENSRLMLYLFGTMANALAAAIWDPLRYCSSKELSRLDERFDFAQQDVTCLVFWTGVPPELARRWAEEHDLSTLTLAMGPLYNDRNPGSVRY
ncbi:uncharacterized protein A1O9_13182, partial [Exophiala aquamarina CBS 119918]